MQYDNDPFEGDNAQYIPADAITTIFTRQVSGLQAITRVVDIKDGDVGPFQV